MSAPRMATALAAWTGLDRLSPPDPHGRWAGCGCGHGDLTHVSFHAAATLTGPVTTGHVIEPVSAIPLDLAAHGYVEQEFFAGGTAMAFKADSMPNDGKWTITPTTSASYKTRILVRRPETPPVSTGRSWSSGSTRRVGSRTPIGTSSTRC